MKSYITKNDDYFIGAGRLLQNDVLQVVSENGIIQFNLANLPQTFTDRAGIDICVAGTLSKNKIIVDKVSFIDVANVIDLESSEYPRKIFILPPDDLMLSSGALGVIGNSHIEGEPYRFLFTNNYNEDNYLFPIFLEISEESDAMITTHKVVQLI